MPLLTYNSVVVNIIKNEIPTLVLERVKDHPRFIPENKASKIKCKKCKTVIYSLYVHDYNSCHCGAIAIDGGTDYFKITGETKNIDFLKGKTDERKKKSES